MINRILPYFIEKANSEDEFIELQTKLFNNGYKWLDKVDGHRIFIPNLGTSQVFIFYPVYISNLSFSDNTSQGKFLRKKFNEHSNDILFFGQQKEVFDNTLLRYEKLKNINENIQSI